MSEVSHELFARCASGFEKVLAQELRDVGMRRVRPLKGGVAFFGSLGDAYRACLWSRVATRVQLVLARVGATDADELYVGTRDVAWERHVRPGATVAVEAHGTNASLRNTTFTALKVKDALCDRLREARGARPDVDPRDPDFAVNVALHDRKATLYLNLSGPSLHRRGYREQGVQTEAPLKETLAAGMLLAAGWPRIAREGGVFADPMCGSGTLAIEAALMAADVAPGLLRERWGFEGWALHDPDVWGLVLADAGMRAGSGEARPLVAAGDLDERAVRIARQNARRAQVQDLVRFHRDDAARLSRHLRAVLRGEDLPGLLATNPPYGQRLLSQADLPDVYASLSAAIEGLPGGWHVALITPDDGIDSALGRVPYQTISCHNGPIEASVRLYDAAARRQVVRVVSLAGAQRDVVVAEPQSEQFSARLRKAAKERSRWARRSGVTCYRIYDADLPDYAVSVDLYAGAGPDEGRRVAVVEERRRPTSVDARRAGRRFADAVSLVGAVLDVPAPDVVARPWRGEGGAGRRALTVAEHGHAFEVSLGGRHDAGLRLGMRGVRELVGRLAAGSFLNLCDESAAASVYAAAGGAKGTLTLCAYPDRVDAARRAMAANGFAGRRHRFERADVRTWLERHARAGETYDLVLCAPPEWMAARTSDSRDWELSRDHASLLELAAKVLSPGGTLVFACLREGFELDAAALGRAGLLAQDAGEQTLAPDFARRGRDHHCWLVRHEGRR